MKPRSRSLSGIVLMLVIMPVLAGLLACIPDVAPIGNPERAKVDPTYTGIWVNEDDSGSSVFYFEPYDKRTWVLFALMPEAGAEADFDDDQLGSYDALVAAMADKDNGIGIRGVTADGVSVYKTWLWKVGGERFMVWQPKGNLRDDGSLGSDTGWSWHLQRMSDDRFELRFVNIDDPRFEDIDLMNRRALEKVIRKHADDESLYAEEAISFVRARPEHAEKFSELLSLTLDGLE